LGGGRKKNSDVLVANEGGNTEKGLNGEVSLGLRNLSGGGERKGEKGEKEGPSRGAKNIKIAL